MSFIQYLICKIANKIYNLILPIVLIPFGNNIKTLGMDLTVGKHYKLTKKLNSGSFGEIYLAINLLNNREVAVKL